MKILFFLIGSTESNISAGLNGLFQIIRIALESNACKESFIQYSLTCAMARVGWLPFENKIAKFLTQNRSDNNPNTSNSNNDDENINYNINNKNKKLIDINYKIEYSVPIITYCLDIKADIEFDFSPTTIRHLISILSMTNDQNKWNKM